MKERLANNFSLKLLSLFLAFFLWLLVVNVSNPRIEGTREVELEILNENILEDAGLTYEIVGKNTVTVTYNVRTLDGYKIDASDFRAYIDLADLYDVTGAVPVNLEVVNNNTLIQSPEVKPGVIHVETEELQKKRFDLKAETTGEPEEGYALGDLTLEPEYLYISGPVSQVGQISEVGVEIAVDGANANLNGTAEPVFYDANGNKLDMGDKVSYDVPEIGYEVEVLKVKSLPLDFQVTGTVADGYRYAGLSSDVQSVPVAGLKSSLSNLTTITIDDPQLTIQGTTKSKTVKIDLTQYIPEDVTIVGGKTEAVVTLDVEELDTRVLTLDLNDISKSGAQSHYHYSYSTESVEVTVQGLSEDLDAMAEVDLNASIDLTGLGVGTTAGKLEFDLAEGVEVLGYTDFQVTVSEQEQAVDSDQASAAEETETVAEHTESE